MPPAPQAVAPRQSALFARWLGSSVLVLEKAPQPGGTARKAAFWYWVPNNQPMRDPGLEDPKPDCLRYMARLARPQRYDPDSPHFGLTEWEYASLRGHLRQRLAGHRAAGRARRGRDQDRAPVQRVVRDAGGWSAWRRPPRRPGPRRPGPPHPRPVRGRQLRRLRLAQAYWAGGATLGPILALAHRAASAAHAERVAGPQPVS
jgi:hypothetical protein